MVFLPWANARYLFKLLFLFCALNVLHCALMKVLILRVILANILLQDPENMIWYTGHSLKLCCVVTVMQRETDTNILVRSKPMHMPINILGLVYGLKLILFSCMGGSKFRLG